MGDGMPDMLQQGRVGFGVSVHIRRGCLLHHGDGRMSMPRWPQPIRLPEAMWRQRLRFASAPVVEQISPAPAVCAHRRHQARDVQTARQARGVFPILRMFTSEHDHI